MNVPKTGELSGSPAASPLAEAKRAALQAQLLRRSLDLQRQQATEISREAEGKGRIIDIRV